VLTNWHLQGADACLALALAILASGVGFLVLDCLARAGGWVATSALLALPRRCRALLARALFCLTAMAALKYVSEIVWTAISAQAPLAAAQLCESDSWHGMVVGQAASYDGCST
jgi:hypothetical protein